MNPITNIAGRVISLEGNDIDTDRIIPARFLLCVTFDGLGESVFCDDRVQAKGKHSFDLPKFQGSSILITGRNFGCGSSREHAPQALKKWGIKALIGESFAEIFQGNCASLGMPCFTLDPDKIQELMAFFNEHHDEEVQLDIEKKTLLSSQGETEIHLDESAREQFLSGNWDAMGQLLQGVDHLKEKWNDLPYMKGFN